MMRRVYGEVYLSVPDENDIKIISQLHHEVHAVRGMFGIPQLYAHTLEKLSESLTAILKVEERK
jgi:hypothetical protein